MSDIKTLQDALDEFNNPYWHKASLEVSEDGSLTTITLQRDITLKE